MTPSEAQLARHVATAIISMSSGQTSSALFGSLFAAAFLSLNTRTDIEASVTALRSLHEQLIDKLDTQ